MIPLSRSRARALVGRDAPLIDLGEGSYRLPPLPVAWRAYVSESYVVLEPAAIFDERPAYSVGKDRLHS